MKNIISTSKAPAAVGPYSQAVRAANFLFVSGQIPLDPESGIIIAGDIAAQTIQSMRNLGATLEAAGMSYADVVKTTVFITDMTLFPKVNETYAEYFPSAAPARSCVQVSALPKGALVEVEAIAVRA